MVIGFTGTRSGMSDLQKMRVKEKINSFISLTEVVHGDCVGSDSDFHDIMREHRPEVKITIRPGVSAKNRKNEEFRANKHGDVVYPEDTHFSRNRKIVDSSDLIIATPYNDEKTGGTWYTIDYAKKKGKSVLIVFRDGSVQYIQR